MSRIICISNRVSLPDPETGEIKAGGLAVGVKAALESNGGGIWFGWDGAICPPGEKRKVSRTEHGDICFLTIPYRKKEYEEYYKGMSNENLWPLMHGLGAHIAGRKGVYNTYREMSRLFARLVKPYLRSGDIIWVHDYHLIPLGKELRALGIRNAIGYFNHIPMPSRSFLNSTYVPNFLKRQFEELQSCLFYYDLVGFQSFRDLRNFGTAIGQDVICPPRFKSVSLKHKGRKSRFGVFPISIETQDIIYNAKQSTYVTPESIPDEACQRTLIGAERLDYTKGLVHRLRGFYRFLKNHPEYQEHIKYQQITPLSRADIEQYKSAIAKTREMAHKIETEFAGETSSPLEYSEEGIPRDELIARLRRSDVGLVTPLIDGQNLVAKEYLASQDPRDPGVLVLSETAGAAEELEPLGALCVDPKDPDDIAAKIEEALEIPRIERIERYRQAIAHLSSYDIEHWTESFLDEIQQTIRASVQGTRSRGFSEKYYNY